MGGPCSSSSMSGQGTRRGTPAGGLVFGHSQLGGWPLVGARGRSTQQGAGGAWQGPGQATRSSGRKGPGLLQAGGAPEACGGSGYRPRGGGGGAGPVRLPTWREGRRCQAQPRGGCRGREGAWSQGTPIGSPATGSEASSPPRGAEGIAGAAVRPVRWIELGPARRLSVPA